MRLVTDFRDYYDHFFTGTGPEFVRVAANAGPDKREQFRILKAAGFKIPPVGTLDELAGLDWWEEGRIRHVVAYTDETAHVGEGKELWHVHKWKTNPHMGGVRRYADKWATFCSAYVEGSRGVSWRRLQIGRHVFWIEYRSTDDWRSNCGDGDVELLEMECPGYHPHIRLPLFAIDFVHGAKDMYAVDFNVAPGVSGSGVQRVLRPWDAAKEIEDAYEYFVANPSPSAA